VPDRAIIPMLPALSLGFICGIIAAALQLEPGPTIAIGAAGAVAVALAGASSVFGTGGETGEKAIVAVLRGACAVALFACMFLFMLDFLRNEQAARSLIWLVAGAAVALVLTQLRVRDRGELHGDADAARD
jgi:hypothetical protein